MIIMKDIKLFTTRFPLNYEVISAYSVEEAKNLMSKYKFSYLFLDHDLSEEDIMCIPGQKTLCPTGMDFVDWLIKNYNPCDFMHIKCHSWNSSARLRMFQALQAKGFSVSQKPFSATSL